MSDQRTANFSQRGFSRNFLRLMKQQEVKYNCCINDPSDEVVFFQIGDGAPFTPVAGTTTYSNPDLPGTINYVEQRAVGTLVSDTDKSYVDIEIASNGKSFTFLSGYLFSPGDTFTLHITI